MKLELNRQIFDKSSNIKFNRNLSSWSRVVPYRRTDMTKVIVAFSSSANAPKIYILNLKHQITWRCSPVQLVMLFVFRFRA
jgi:hypothetical protein